MPVIRNKTRGPLSIPLPRGKTLHLGLGRTAEIAPTALEHPPVRKRIDSGDLEVVGETHRPATHVGSARKFIGPAHGRSSGGTGRSSGDR